MHNNITLKPRKSRETYGQHITMDELNRYKAKLLESTNDVVLITDNNLDNPVILYVNKAFEDLTGFTKEEAIGQTPRILQGPNTDINTLRRIKRSMVLTKPIHVEVLNYSKNGREYWLDFSVIPLFDDKGNISYFGAIEREITQQKIAQNSLYELANKDEGRPGF